MAHGKVRMNNGRKRRDYPDERATYDGRDYIYPWRQRSLGRDALVVMYHAVEERCSSSQLAQTRDFSGNGINAAYLLQWLEQYVPDFCLDYEQVTGSTISADRDRLMGRVYMWFLKHRGKGLGCEAGISPEHPLNWAGDLIDIWDKRITEHGKSR